MQPRAAAALLATALFGALPSAAALSASATAESRAEAWLRAHRGAPQADELDELKTANPMAYGIVKALLMKRSLGLLDPKHPTATFAAAPPKADEDALSGPEAFQKIAVESGEKPKEAPLYPDVAAAPVHHNWLSWKPQQSAIDDESMVQNVLGAAAEAKVGADQPQAAPAVAVPAGLDAAAPAVVESPAAPIAAAAAAASVWPAEKPVASMNQQNSYLEGMDWGKWAPPAPLGKSAQEHTRPHTAIGLSSKHASTNYLASFSWGDDTPEAQPAQAGGAEKGDALLTWLSPRKARSAPTAPPAKENSYLLDLGQ